MPPLHWRAAADFHGEEGEGGLLLERIMEQACNDTGRNIRDDLKRIKLAQLSSPNGVVWQITEPARATSKRLKSLKIYNPPPLLDVR